MEPITEGVEQVPATLDQPAGTQDVSSDTPSDVEMQAMADLFGAEAGADDHQADPTGDDALTLTDADQGEPAQSADAPWEQLTDEQRRAGFLRQRDYTQKTQRLAEERQQTQALQAQVQQQQQQLLEMQQQIIASRQPQPEAAQQPQAPTRPNPNDFLDDVGDVDFVSYADAMNDYAVALSQAAVQAALQSEVTPLRETLTKQQDAAQQQAAQAVIQQFEVECSKMATAFPHFAQVEQQVLQAIVDSGATPKPEMVRAYYSLHYPQQYAQRLLQYKQAQAQAAQRTPTNQQGLTLAPGQHSGAREAAPSDPQERRSAMAEEFVRLNGR